MTNEDVLNLVFKLSDSISYEVNNNIVTVLEKQNHFIQRYLRKLNFKIPTYRKIELDEYSSFIFLQVDGYKTVNQIGSNLELAYGKDCHPLYERLLLFLNHIEVNCKYIEKINN